jgi:hypothetical protein
VAPATVPSISNQEVLAMDESDPKYLHEDEGRDIADEVKDVEHPPDKPATGYGGAGSTEKTGAPPPKPKVKE